MGGEGKAGEGWGREGMEGKRRGGKEINSLFHYSNEHFKHIISLITHC